MIKNKPVLSLEGNCLTVHTASGISRTFGFPAAAISVNGKRIEARTSVAPVVPVSGGGWCTSFADGHFHFIVTVTPGEGDWFYKEVEVVSEIPLPTPDYLEVDRQNVYAPGIKSCGYKSTRVDLSDQLSEEEGAGVVPGCGYPLAGDDLFTGLEHPAAFNTLLETRPDGSASWQLRHFPLWQGNRITGVRAVTGLSKDPRKLFHSYLEQFRLPGLSKPYFTVCTFWSDPYQGAFEYVVEKESYSGMLNGFKALGLHFDGYTLDAGWQDRRSFFRANSSYGGEEALKKFAAELKESGSALGLWVSHNGPVGMDMDFLKSQGITVGGGISCHYSGDNYAVLLDRKLEELFTRRLCELALPEYGCRFFKMDWDNECATAPGFEKLYPTRDHVREATLNIMARINRTLRNINPRIMTRNGRWPSPWLLSRTTHISLADGGDCEYADFPALSQRDASTTHRDTVYYCAHVRDNSFCPLDVYDNHEFAHALRNPFQESPGVWSNCCIWAVMRGVSYHQFALQPEALEEWQVKILAGAMELLRSHAPRIITGRSRMVGGNPAAGSIYGFFHPGPKNGEFLLGLRNPSPLPREYKLPGDAPFYEQCYPDCRIFSSEELITFAPHEVKILRGCAVPGKKDLEYPCQLFPAGRGKWQYFLPSSRRPGVPEIHRISELQKLHADAELLEEGSVFTFGIRVPFRMREFKVCFKVSGSVCDKIKVRLYTARSKNCRASAYALPVSELPWGRPGMGEKENPDVIPVQEGRFFAAELPQGGEVFCRLEVTGAAVKSEDLELWVTGFEAPAREAEKKKVPRIAADFIPLPHPSGFPLNLRIW